MSWPALARRAAKGIAILLVSFILAEIALRAYAHFHPTFIFFDPSYNRFRGNPGAPDYDFHLNSLGFKDVEFKQQKEAGTYRIVALGDSCAFGVVPYQHNYLTLLEENLRGNGRRVEVLNMGIISTGPEQYLALLANEGLGLKPDMVLVSFFTGNDFTDTLAKEPRRWWQYSAVATLVRYVVDLNLKYQGRLSYPGASYDDNEPTFTDVAYLRMEVDRSLIYLRRRPFKKAFADAVAYLVRIKDLCEARGVVLTVVIIPDEVQVSQGLQAKVMETLRAPPEEIDFALPNRFLGEELEVQQVDCVDLLSDFVVAAVERALYKPRNSHWNIAGNRLAAEVLARHLAAKLGGPGAPDPPR
ncbi:MAG: SGNH/GDSL hydrolase family protein [Planctomycetes bacterium]|nr:SGNH/GDSL hydrolase family protein [Planctomycetota bacterium]